MDSRTSQTTGSSDVLVTVPSAQNPVAHVVDSISMNSMPEDAPPGRISPTEPATLASAETLKRDPPQAMVPPRRLRYGS